MSSKKSKSSKSKSGGSLADDAGRLAIPLGLLLAKQSLQDFLKKNSSAKSDAPSTRRARMPVARRVVSGGNTHEAPVEVVKASEGLHGTWAAVPETSLDGGKNKKSSSKKSSKK